MLLSLVKTGNVGDNLALIPGEVDVTIGGDGPADTYSASVTYKTGPFYVGLAVDSYDDTGAAVDSSNSLTRLVGTYKIKGMQFGLLVQNGVEKVATSTAEEDWLGLSFGTKLGSKHKIKAQYIMVENNAAIAKESTLAAIGYDNKFAKNTTRYVMYSAIEDETGGTTGDEETSLSTGMFVKF